MRHAQQQAANRNMSHCSHDTRSFGDTLWPACLCGCQVEFPERSAAEINAALFSHGHDAEAARLLAFQLHAAIIAAAAAAVVVSLLSRSHHH